MVFLRFHRNSDFKLLNLKNDLTLWDEYKHHKTVAPKASLQFSSEDISFLTTNLRVPLNIPSQNPQRQFPNWATLCKLQFFEMNAQVREQFLRMLLSGFYFRIFHFSQESSMRWKISQFQFHRKSVQTLLYEKTGVTPWGECTHHKAVSQKLFSAFYLKIFFLYP